MFNLLFRRINFAGLILFPTLYMFEVLSFFGSVLVPFSFDSYAEDGETFPTLPRRSLMCALNKTGFIGIALGTPNLIFAGTDLEIWKKIL